MNDGASSGKPRVDISTPEGIQKLSKRIRAAYSSLAKGDGDADDCVQEILCRMLEGKHQHSTINQCVIDYLRTESGRKGSPGYTARLNLKYANPIGPGADEPATRVDYRGVLDDRRNLEFIENISGKSGEVLRMSVIDEKKLREIGTALGLTESRASQLLSAAKEKVQVLLILPSDLRTWASKYVF